MPNALRIPRNVLAALLIWLIPAVGFAAPAGTVLVAVGDISALRAGTTLRLEKGAEVMSGDTIITGAASNVQLRMTDGSIMALRPETRFMIEDYRFQQNSAAATQEERSVFNLLKGGLRTITGLIGKRSRDNYEMKTATATVGIRGTHYNLVLCQQDCRNKDNTPARDGLYGNVLDGSIALKNQAQERVFGKDDVFYVPDAQSPPEKLLAPPSFLRDKLDGQSRSRQGQQQAGETQQARTDGQKGGPNDAPPAPVESPRAVETPAVLPVTETPLQLAQDILTNTVETNTVTVTQFSGQGDGVVPQQGFTARFLSAEYNTSGGGHNAFNNTTDATLIMDATGIVSTGNYMRNSAQSYESGADGGAIAWGRWANGTAYLSGWANQTLTADQGFHIIYGIIPSSAPAQNSVTFNLIGATRPTETTNIANGNVWNVTGGSMTANFLSGSYSGSLAIGLTSTAGQSTYNMAFSSSSLNAMATNSWSGSVTNTGGAGNVCSPTCSATGTLIFAGQTATHAGTIYEFAKTTDGIYVQGAAAFKR